MNRSSLPRRALLVIAIAGLMWAAVVAWTGGLVLEATWIRLSSRSPDRPLFITTLAGLAYYLWYRQWWTADAGKLAVVRWPPLLASVFCVVALIVGIRLGTFTAGAADASGYVSQAELWLHRSLIVPAPEWVAEAPWTNAAGTASPLGYIPGPRPLTQVPMYSPGLPMLMALFQSVGGRDGVYYVVPLLGAVLIWMTYLIGTHLTGPWGGAIASALMVSSPTFLAWLVMPMTDVPIAAWWAVAIAMALRGTPAGSVAAGLATSAAILTRPNLVPLAAIVALMVLARSRRPLTLVFFAAGALPSAVAVAAINAHLYGSPLESGYGSLQQIYAVQRILPNASNYSGWLLATQTPAIVLAALAPFLMDRPKRVIVGAVCVGFPLAVIGLYLPYLVFDHWLDLRFVISAYPGLFAGMATAIVFVCRRPGAGTSTIAAAALMVAALTLRGFGYSHTPAEFSRSEVRYQRVAEHAQGLSPAAVFITRNHSGSLRYYAGRDIVRWDILEPAEIDTAVDYLGTRGHDVYVVVDDDEAPLFRTRFAASRTVRQLDDAAATEVSRVRIYALAAAPQ